MRPWVRRARDAAFARAVHTRVIPRAVANSYNGDLSLRALIVVAAGRAWARKADGSEEPRPPRWRPKTSDDSDVPRVDRRPVSRLRDRPAEVTSGGEPRLLGLLDLGERFLGRAAESRAPLEVENVGDIAAVLVAVEDVDVVIAQPSSSIVRA